MNIKPSASPIKIEVEPEKIYAWCTCGLSDKQPFCDGQHKKIVGEKTYQSLKIQFEEKKEIWFCVCKKTKTPPFCDGSHQLVD